MIRFVTYLWYVIRHKWFVFVACCRLGIPWLGVVHDLSKLSPCEFGPYSRQFFNSDGSRRSVRDKTGAYDPNKQNQDFKAAWLFHQRNKHHWQAWISIGNRGNLVPLPMPRKYCVEMVADWCGAGMAISGEPNPCGWYKKNRDDLLLHPRSRDEIETILEQEFGYVR